MSKIVVLGAGGMLGHKVCQALDAHDLVGVVRRPAREYERFAEVFAGTELIGGVDALREDALEGLLGDLGPQVVINCIGLVKQLDEAADAYLSIAINSLLPHRLARLCERLGARLVHLSTDCVFDGDRGSYREGDLTNARDLYGRSKALGETLPTETSAVTLRTSFIGRELQEPTHGLLDWFLARDGAGVDGYAKVVYSGLTSLELAGVIRLLVEGEAELSGVYQVASEPISKHDLLVLVREIYGLDVEIRRVAEPVSDRSLVMAAFTEAVGYSAPSWPEMIRRMHADPTPYDAWRAAR